MGAERLSAQVGLRWRRDKSYLVRGFAVNEVFRICGTANVICRLEKALAFHLDAVGSKFAAPKIHAKFGFPGFRDVRQCHRSHSVGPVRSRPRIAPRRERIGLTLVRPLITATAMCRRETRTWSRFARSGWRKNRLSLVSICQRLPSAEPRCALGFEKPFAGLSSVNVSRGAASVQFPRR